MSKTCPSKCYGGSVAEVAKVIRDKMVIGGKSFAWYSESVNVRKDEFDTKTSEASHGFLERMPNLDKKCARNPWQRACGEQHVEEVFRR